MHGKRRRCGRSTASGTPFSYGGGHICVPQRFLDRFLSGTVQLALGKEKARSAFQRLIDGYLCGLFLVLLWARFHSFVSIAGSSGTCCARLHRGSKTRY